MLTAIRWWMFVRLSSIGWWICPEPHRSRLQSVMPSWKDIESGRAALEGE